MKFKSQFHFQNIRSSRSLVTAKQTVPTLSNALTSANDCHDNSSCENHTPEFDCTCPDRYQEPANENNQW